MSVEASSSRGAGLPSPSGPNGNGSSTWEVSEPVFASGTKKQYQLEDDKRELEFTRLRADLTVRNEALNRERLVLQSKLRDIELAILDNESELARITEEYELEALQLLRRRQQFNEANHGHDELSPVQRPGQLQYIAPAPTPSSLRGTIGERQSDGPDLAEVVDSEGDVIDIIKPLAFENEGIRALLGLHAKRKVKIRPGIKFTRPNLNTIYFDDDPRRPKWTACMIQATGTVQPEGCSSCQEGYGVFGACVRVNDPRFEKCGNCEWAKKPCSHGRGTSDGSGLNGREFALRERGSTQTGVASGAGSVDMMDLDDAPINTIVSVHRPQPRVVGNSSPTGSAGPVDTIAERRSGFVSINKRQLGPALLVDNASNANDGGRKRSSGSTEPNSPEPELSDEEKKALMKPAITLKHDGTVYTDPAMMRGVPVAKIDMTSPYMDPNWKDPLKATEELLASYKEKHEEALRKDIKNTKFLLGRQVRRGQSIMKFLKQGSFHPYQLVAKPWMQGGLGTYDTLFRMVHTIEELEKFKVQVAPVDWLRQRLIEIMEECETNKETFSLAKTMKEMYRDKKLCALRKLCGFGNIGRPSGMKDKDSTPRNKRKVSPNTGSNRRESHTKRSRGAKRSSLAADTTMDDSLVVDSPTSHQVHGMDPVRHSTEEDVGGDEFEFDGITDTDSVHNQSVDADDFKVMQLRTRKFTSLADNTQYWHYDAELDFLDLQVLKSVVPTPDWLSYDPPVDFVVELTDVQSVTHHPESLKVHVVRKEPDGSTSDIMASLKRENTKRRLLALFRNRGCDIRMADSSAALRNLWFDMGEHSEILNEQEFNENGEEGDS